MHELSLSSAILDTVLRHADGRRVSSVDMTIGALRQVVPSSLEFYWEIVSRDTVCAGASLELTLMEAQLRCKGCGKEWTIDDPIFRCPDCLDAEVEILRGNEFLVESINVTDKEDACIAQR